MEKQPNEQEKYYMKKALLQAKSALKNGEVPIGAVVVYKGKIIGRGYNKRLKKQLASAHAEMEAIDKACRLLKSWRLPDAEIYVTLEPCPMCMGAILNSRIERLYFGAYEQKGKAFTNELANANLLNHTVEVHGGVLEQECGELITDFFSDMREKTQIQEDKPKTYHYTYAFTNEQGRIVKIGIASGDMALQTKLEKEQKKGRILIKTSRSDSMQQAQELATAWQTKTAEELKKEE